MRALSPTDFINSVASGAFPAIAIHSGTSDSTGSFFSVAGSALLIPSSIWFSRGAYLSDPWTFVGLFPVAIAIDVPMDESWPDTVPL